MRRARFLGFARGALLSTLHDALDRSLHRAPHGSLLSVLIIAVQLGYAPQALAQSPRTSYQPEAATPSIDGAIPRKSALVGRRYMAVTAHPVASEAAQEVLRAGGSAMDAAIAAQWVLNLVEPQSSGIGGGGFLLHWDAANKTLSAWDGRETAPAKLPETFAQNADGTTRRFDDILRSAQAVGTPGLVAMLAKAHARYGRLPWARTFAFAISRSEGGFALSPRLYALLQADALLRADSFAAQLYYQADGTAKPVGTVVRNPALAESLRTLAALGSQGFYHGELAQRMVDVVQQRGGSLSADDLASYQPIERAALCAPYRAYQVCGMPPPSSGAVTVGQLLGILEHSRSVVAPLDSPDAIHAFAEAGRLAFADRARYLADPAFALVPTHALLSPAYLAQRAALIDSARSMGVAAPGELPSVVAYSAGVGEEIPATTHLSIVDAQGNAVSLTSSIEAAFGSRIMVDGFLLNNQLTDFALTPPKDGTLAANRPQPGKRPLSSMAPTVVFAPDGSLYAVLGSPGGQRIINYVARSLVALIDGAMTPEQAVSLAHAGSRNSATEIENTPTARALAEALKARGHTVRIDDMTSGIHLITRYQHSAAWAGAADPRREGLVAAD
jgi:gamma-glutamyltranspeptidase / glutathione hydrolase